ncbi:HAMP domain-containing sensor histidine kinase [Anaerocolumna xylanovorans]|uniref:histidine kinase n=1 Tax=Anaerocolumna xylanovorans DSM 12503 TaxID=1121345 RepID=A0A1M7YML9_9FIRM|nr:HAMP domain-containing sensor histidine kinase [Anaerocolumna xylanovorans]SHO53913.1 Signal transduction histidine kinase [Anaerocolumna xylanovorans DSM 12503]
MNLSRKTFAYSTVISILIVSLLLGYFIFMLPSLYVAYMQDRNYSSVIKLQEGYMKTGSYDNLEVKNPSGTLTVELPLTGDTIYALNQFVRVSVKVRDEKLLQLLDKFRYYARHTDEMKDFKEEDISFDELKQLISIEQYLPADYPLNFSFEIQENNNVFRQLSSRVHRESDKLLVFESSVTDGSNYYTSYIALGLTDEVIDITFLPVMTPRIDEIKPVILQSLPMIAAVALLLVLISSQLFSKLIIIPIIKLSNHAKYMTEAETLYLEPVSVTGHDEISSLAESLNELYQKIQQNYQELEIKNRYLAEENKRQEVFLRASSHQLKTPIAAALLLVESMIHEVGKYKDTRAYLPQVKQQLQSMKKIVEDLLYLNHCSKELQKESFSLKDLIEECIGSYHVQLEEKSLHIITDGMPPALFTDPELLKKILDNLLSNAICFTPKDGRIAILYEEHRLCILNYGAAIEEELLPHIFEPFVSSITGNRAHGLGLYVASYYAKLLNCRLNLSNTKEGVMAELIFA